MRKKIQTWGFWSLIQVTIYFDDFISSTSGNFANNIVHFDKICIPKSKIVNLKKFTIAKQRVLWNLVQTFKFGVELVYVHVFSLFSIELIFVKYLFQYSDPHIAKFVSREIEVLSSSLWQILIPHIALVFCKPLFHLSIRLTNILDVTFLACDQINDIWWGAVNFSNNLIWDKVT